MHNNLLKAMQRETTRATTAPENYKTVMKESEKRTRHLQLLVTPTLFAKLQGMAKDNGISVNELCNQALLKITGAPAELTPNL